jgi:hypothetical protein
VRLPLATRLELGCVWRNRSGLGIALMFAGDNVDRHPMGRRGSGAEPAIALLYLAVITCAVAGVRAALRGGHAFRPRSAERPPSVHAACCHPGQHGFRPVCWMRLGAGHPPYPRGSLHSQA